MRSGDRPLADDGEAVAAERDRRVMAVGEQDHVVDAQRGEDLRADAIIAQLLGVAALGLAGADLQRLASARPASAG